MCHINTVGSGPPNAWAIQADHATPWLKWTLNVWQVPQHGEARTSVSDDDDVARQDWDLASDGLANRTNDMFVRVCMCVCVCMCARHCVKNAWGGTSTGYHAFIGWYERL